MDNSFKNDYLKHLLELIETYGRQDVADKLEVSLRSIQFYISDTNRKVPHENTMRKIDELYRRHKEGKGIAEQKRANHNTLHDEIVELLREKAEMLKQQNDDYRNQLRIKDARVDEIFKTTAELQVMNKLLSSELQEVKGLLKIATAYALAHFRAFQIHRLKTEKQAQEAQIADEMRSLYGEALAEAMQG